MNKISFNYLGRNVEINEKIDINNIKYIISQMEKQPTEEVIEENNIKGYFTLSSGIEVPFKMSDNNILIMK